MRWMPAGWTPSLFRSWGRGPSVRDDILAGVVLTGLLVPAGMGYAEAAGLPAITGLYATVVCLVAYALLGPSRVLILGPDSSLAPIIAAIVAPIAVARSAEAVAVAGLLAVLTGAVLVLAGVLRLGLLADLLSKPIRVGYLNGVALVLVISQLPKLFGFAVDGDGVIATGRDFLEGLLDRNIVGPALAIGAGSLVVMLVMKRRLPRVPGLLLGVVGASLVVWVGGLEDQLPVVGEMPSGLPSPALGSLSWQTAWTLLPGALGLALIASADTGVLSRSLASRVHEDTDQSHEMAALGAANIATGLLGGFPISASSSRTPVALGSGARSQLTGIVGAFLVMALVMLAPRATALLPSSVLAAVVIVAATSLAEPTQMTSLWRARRFEGVLALVAFLGVTLAGPLRGIGVAVLLSLAAFVLRAWRPYVTELVRVRQRKGYHDVARHPAGERIPGLVIARFDAPLFFANAGVFQRAIQDLVAAATPNPSWVVISAEPITDIDTTAADMLVELDELLASSGVHLVFAELKGPVKDHLADYGLTARFGPDRHYPTLGTAVAGFLAATDTAWEDWTDR